MPEPVEGIEEVAVRLASGKTAYVRARLEDCVIFNGMSFGLGGFHPFTFSALELMRDWSCTYDQSWLKRFYQGWQPADAADALLLQQELPAVLRRFPAYLMPEPWSEKTLAERQQWVEQTMRWESPPVGEPFTPADGHGLQGPVSDRKGAAELDRIRRPLRSMRRQGIDHRRAASMAVQVLRRGDERRFRVVHGHHRCGVASALGHENLIIRACAVIDVEGVQDWPQVSAGVWTVRQAEAYFHHHFDFDATKWAGSIGLIPSA